MITAILCRRLIVWLSPVVVLLVAAFMIVVVGGDEAASGTAQPPCDSATAGEPASAQTAALNTSPSRPAGAAARFDGRRFDTEQLDNAAIIVRAAKSDRVPVHGWVVALAAAMQESGLRNLHHGDRDSLGLFQQRPSAGWGTRLDLLDPRYAARAFFGGPHRPSGEHERGLLDVRGWQQMSVTEAAQAVQQSAFPSAYAQWQETAAALATRLTGVNVTGCATITGTPASVPSGPVGRAIAFATDQLGKPYVWGAAGPSTYDCSGLVLRAWNAGGVVLPRTSREQYGAGSHLPVAAAQPGDLLFWAYDRSNAATIHHVAIYLGRRNGRPTIIEAPEPGKSVQYRTISLSGDPELVPEATRVHIQG